ncbi:MAG: hypothetical protein WC795_00970 [Candidatus Paceibacterota bacterium]|jgi:hypothetical protein
MLKTYSKFAKAALGLFVGVLVLAGASVAHAYTFNTNLKMGMTSPDVKELQKVLNTDAATLVSASGAGSIGMETSYFGAKTHSAVLKFQAKHNISPVAGFVGSITRGVLNSMGGSTTLPAGCTSTTGFSPTTGVACSTTLTTTYPAGCSSTAGFSSTTGQPCSGSGTSITGSVTVSLSSENPASGYIATGSANNKVLGFNITNSTSSTVNVSGVNLTKTGYYGNTNIAGISVYDGSGVRHGNVVTTLGADGIAIMTFSSDPIVIAAGQTMTLWVKVNVASTSNAGTLGFNIKSASDVIVSGGTVGGSFPISGNLMSVIDGTSSIGTTTFDVQPVNASGITMNADATSAQEITKFRIRETSSNEDVRLHGFKVRNNGNASATDYKDVELLDQTGSIIATAQPSTNGDIMFTLATPYLITKGQTKDFTIRAKIVDGASRTIQFVVEENGDVDLRGVSTGAGLLPAAGTTDTSFPIGDATNYNLVTIGSGTLTFVRATDSPSVAVVPGANDVVLAKYRVKPVGENMELRQVSFGLDQDASSVALTGTVFVKVNGAVVYSAAANTTNFPVVGTASARSLSSYYVLPAGTDSFIEVTASISSSATSSDAYFVNDFDITSVKRLLTNDTIDPTVSVSDGFTRAVQAASLSVTTLTTPVAASVVAGTNNFELANFEFNAQSSGEDARISSIVVTDTIGGAAAYSNIANLVMKDSAGTVMNTSSSTSVNANTVTFSFTSPIIVGRSTNTTLKLYGDIITGTSGTHTYKIASGGVTATGKDTGNSISSPTIAGSGQAMTLVAGGTLTLSTVSGTGATPTVAQIVKINTMNGIYLSARLTSQYEAQKITSLQLRATGTALTQNNLSNIRVYAQAGTGALLDATTAFQTASLFSTCTSNICYYTFTATDNLLPMTINPGTPVTLYVKADILGENTAKLGNDFYMSVAAQTAQVNTVTPTAVNSTVYTTTINGTAITYTSDASATVAEITAGLTAAINLSAQASVVTAADGTTVYTVTSDTAGLPFTISVDANQANVATTANGGIIAKGSVTNSAPTYAGSANLSGSVNTIVPFQILASGEYPTNGSSTTSNVGAGTVLGRFKVTNNGSAQVTLTNAKFTDSGAHTGTAARYTVYASSENSSDYLANSLEVSGTDSVDFGSLTATTTINGGSYRYITVTISTVTTVAIGDTFSLSIANIGDLKFSVTEANLGYDGEQDGDITGTITALPADGKPALGTIQKTS